MYRVQLKYIELNSIDSPIVFDCQQFEFRDNSYQFINIIMNNFYIRDLEVSNEDIALIKIM